MLVGTKSRQYWLGAALLLLACIQIAHAQATATCSGTASQLLATATPQKATTTSSSSSWIKLGGDTSNSSSCASWILFPAAAARLIRQEMTVLGDGASSRLDLQYAAGGVLLASGGGGSLQLV